MWFKLRLSKWWWLGSLLGNLYRVNSKFALLIKWLAYVIFPLGFIGINLWYSPIKNITIQGRDRSQAKELLSYLGVNINHPMHRYSVKELYSNLSKMPWLYSVFISKMLPDKIFIRIVERYPESIWQNAHGQFLVDNQGHIIAKIHKVSLKMLNHLKIIRGQNANIAGPTLINAISAFPQILEKFVAATWVQNRRWNILLKNGILIKLSEDNMFKNLQKLCDLHKKHQILERDLSCIDIRTHKVIINRNA